MNRALNGALAWLSVAHFFVVEELVRRSWPVPYSRRANYLSDLGATTCGPYFGRQICSPDHVWINVSFGLVGGAIILGAVLLRPVASDLLMPPLLTLYLVGGLGSVLVGLFPLDTVRPLHALGGGLFFGGTNLAHVLLGARLVRRGARPYGAGLILGGLAGLLAAVLVADGSTLGGGVGFVQRLAVYATVIGVVASGLLLLTGRPMLASQR